MAKRRDDSWHPLFFLLSLSLFSFCLYPLFLYAIFIAVSSSSSSCQLIANTFDVLFTRCVISSIDKWRNGEKEMKDGKKRKREMKEEKGTKLKMERKTLKVVAQSCQDISLLVWKGKKEKERERVRSCYSRRKIGGEIFLSCATSILFLTPGALIFEAFASKMVLFSLLSSFFSSLSFHPLSLGSIIWNDFTPLQQLTKSHIPTDREMSIVGTHKLIYNFDTSSTKKRENKRKWKRETWRWWRYEF